MKKNVFILALMLTTGFTFAQDAPAEAEAASATTFAGSADAYTRYDFGKALSNNQTSFTRSTSSFELGMVSLEASHTSGKASVFVDLGFGTRAQEFTYNDGYTSFMVKAATFDYQVTDKFKVTMGSFGTHVGYELLDAVDNKNYSMSYAFTNGPFFNTGLKGQYTEGAFSFMLGLTNPTDFKSALTAGSRQKTIIGQVAYVTDAQSVYLNVTSGSANNDLPTGTGDRANKSQIDLVATKQVNEKMGLGLNATYAMVKDDFVSALDGNWFSAVGYLTYAAKENLTVAYRLEYFSADAELNKFGLVGVNEDLGVIANTLSLNWTSGNLTVIPEIRFDSANIDAFMDADNKATGTAASFLLATTYSF